MQKLLQDIESISLIPTPPETGSSKAAMTIAFGQLLILGAELLFRHWRFKHLPFPVQRHIDITDSTQPASITFTRTS